MIDTLKLKSPELEPALYAALEASLCTRATVDNATGELVSAFTFGALDGSYDHRVSVRLLDSETVMVGPFPESVDIRALPVQRVCKKVVIEGSVHKAMLGHNVVGGPECPRAASRWFVAYVGGLLGLSLPDGDFWHVMRVDIAEAFDLGDFGACQEYIHALSLARYPRRKVSRWGDECVSFAGSTTCYKLYHKGPEFSKHDRRRLWKRVERASSDADGSKRIHNRWVESLQARADGIIRVETSVKSHKLKRQFGGYPQAMQLECTWLESLHDLETARVLRDGENEMRTVCKTHEVKSRLSAFYTQRQAASLFSSWAILTTMGEDQLRRELTRRTFYRHRKELVEAGVSWHGSDLQIVEHSAIPEGFRPVRSDPRRIVGEDPRVREMLHEYRAAV